MKSINKNFIFFKIIGLLIVTACSINDNKNHNDNSDTNDLIHIFIKTDSTFELNNEQFKISQLENVIDGANNINSILVSPNNEIKMSTIIDIEGVLASKSIQNLTYISGNDSLNFYLDEFTSELIELKLTKNDQVWLDGQIINDDKEFISQIKIRIENNPHSKIGLILERGTGYNFYINEKKRIQRLLFEIDSNLILTEEVYNKYVRKN